MKMFGVDAIKHLLKNTKWLTHANEKNHHKNSSILTETGRKLLLKSVIITKGEGIIVASEIKKIERIATYVWRDDANEWNVWYQNTE